MYGNAFRVVLDEEHKTGAMFQGRFDIVFKNYQVLPSGDEGNEGAKEAADLKIINEMNSTGRAKCDAENKISLSKVELDKTALKVAKDLANSTAITANASAALGATEPSKANAKKALADEEAAIDAAILAAVADE